MKNLRLKTGAIYGLVTSVLSILIGMALHFMGLNDFSGGGSSGWVNILILVLGIYLASEAFKKENEGFATTGDIVVMSIFLGLVMGLVSGLYSAIYMHYIDPSIMEKIRNVAEAKMEEAGNNEEQMEMALSIMDKMMSPGWLVLMATLMNTLFAVVVGALLSIFLKKERPIFD